jgi:hypothetical protein
MTSSPGSLKEATVDGAGEHVIGAVAAHDLERQIVGHRRLLILTVTSG